MPRQARVVVTGAPHHITQRGNNRQDVFLLDADRYRYVQLLTEHSRLCGMQILGHCLMTNHVHLVAVPKEPDSLANTLRRTQQTYAARSRGGLRRQITRILVGLIVLLMILRPIGLV